MLDVLGALVDQYRMATVSQDVAALAAACEQGVGVFSFGSVAHPTPASGTQVSWPRKPEVN